MVQSIELLLDEAGDAGIRASWAALAEAGLPSLASHAGGTNRPHVTVAVTDGSGFERAATQLRAVFEGSDLAGSGLAATIGAPVLFGGHRRRWVLTRQVVLGLPLLTLHGAVHRTLHLHAPEAPIVALTAPDAWTPHVSLARRIDADRLGEALSALDPAPLPCRFVGARLWDSVEKAVTTLA